MVHFITKSGDKSRTEALIEEFLATPKAAGFCSPALTDGGITIGYELMDLTSRETVPFARLPEKIPENWNEEIRHGKFSFSGEGFSFAREIIDRALQDTNTVLFLDEIGKLELKGSGFNALLRRCVHEGADLVIGCRKANIKAIQAEFGIE